MRTICWFVLCVYGIQQVRGYTGACEDQAGTTVQAYNNWPFQVDCDHLEKIWAADPRRLADDVLECEVEADTVAVQRESLIFVVSSDRGQAFFVVKLIINNESCISSSVEVRLSAVQVEACGDYHDRVYVEDVALFRELESSQMLLLDCSPPGGSPDVIPQNATKSDFKTTWTHNCENALERHSRSHEVKEGQRPDSLRVPNTDFYDVGNYTCEVEYNGTTLRVVTYSICVKQSVPTGHQATMICTTEMMKAPGETVTFECSGLVSIGTLYEGDISVTWSTDSGEEICKSSVYGEVMPGLVEPRYTCSIHGDNSSRICETVTATFDSKPQTKTRAVDIKLDISDLESRDFRSYSVALQFKNTHATGTVELTEDLTPFYQGLVVKLGIVLGIIIFIIIVAFLVKRNEIYIKIYYKRSRLWKYDEDIKPIVAYLSYHYNTEQPHEITKRVVGLIHEELDRLDYSFYDENVEGNFGNRIEAFANNLENSHRMVVILTPDYINDRERWARFQADAAYHNVLQAGLGLVFVTTPGARRELQKQAAKDEVWARVAVAIKANPVIEWKEGMSDEKFQHYVEYHMPKLRRNAYLPIMYNAQAQDVQMQV